MRLSMHIVYRITPTFLAARGDCRRLYLLPLPGSGHSHITSYCVSTSRMFKLRFRSGWLFFFSTNIFSTNIRYS